jgi:hypothetical protein
MRNNERVWAGHIIGWIRDAIQNRRTIFQDATNDTGIKLESGKTKFPDILLFSDRVSGIVFNGWELKFPDTPVDDQEMLKNALEKAKKLQSDSFVTWNGTEAVIWKIKDDRYNLTSLNRLKHYPPDPLISSREDLANPIKYQQNEVSLRNRLDEILHDLEQFHNDGYIRPAINISGNVIQAIKTASEIIIPQFKEQIIQLKNHNSSFRSEFNKWKIYESSTLKILSTSSRRSENVIEEEVLAKFSFYNLIGKILFYLTLSENLSGNLEKIRITQSIDVKKTLDRYFDEAKKIDYQAVFKPYFTDILDFSKTTSKTVFELLSKLSEFDFRVLPSDVIGTILENLVPSEEKQKFGQYFTSPVLANLVAFPAIRTPDDIIFDPTSGTGSFLNSFYKKFNFFGLQDHNKLLSQIWGNDISHFPAILSVINLYKQDVGDPDNFPRVMRDDYFNLSPGMVVAFPDSSDHSKNIEQNIPHFDGISSNLPFIQQEDIPNERLTELFKNNFEESQSVFLNGISFRINERSDYFTYCIYHSLAFLKDDGILSVITSNAWLGKEYGVQFKKFILDNYHIKYVVRSSAEHWFKDSKVSTIYAVFQKDKTEEPTKFVTVNCKLGELFEQKNALERLQHIENFYSEIEYCNDERNKKWETDDTFEKVYHKTDGSIDVSLVAKSNLIKSLKDGDNWLTFFISPNLFEEVEEYLTPLYPGFIDAFRGERTGWNPMFVIPSNKIDESGIEDGFLVPYVKSPSELNQIEFSDNYSHYLFVCDLSMDELRNNYPGAHNWIRRFENQMNTNKTKTIPEACANHNPFWYSLNLKSANIITSINPYERHFFCYSEQPFTIDQRLAAINVRKGYEIKLIAALLNSVITLLTIEMRGTSRNLGALDLNANYFKSLKVLNPDLLSSEQAENIIEVFETLTNRPIDTVEKEILKEDRRNFDTVILQSFGIDTLILDSLYQTLTTAVKDRVSMKDK